MRALVSNQPGTPDTLTLEDLPEPTAGPGEVVVDVAAAALNFFDTLIIRDRYQYKPDRPFSPSAECAGVISSLGEGVTDFAVGDRVAAYAGWGCVREQVAIPASKLVRVPDALDLDIASGLIVTYGTSLHALKDRADMQPGETVAVLGAAGGTGVAAIELAKAMGGHVIACASSPEKVAFARSLGADEGVNYGQNDLKEALKSLTDGQGVDVVYDPVGGDLAEAALRATAWKGRFLVVGFASGDIPRPPLNLALLKGLDILGVFWGRFGDLEPQHFAQNNADIMQWAAEGKLSGTIHARHSFDNYLKAFDDITSRRALGKVLLKP